MKRKNLKTLNLIFAHPISANVRWSDVEALLLELGAQIEEREGSRVLIRLFGGTSRISQATPHTYD